MRKIQNYSVQFKINDSKTTQPHQTQTAKNKTKLTKDRQEFIKSITASGFKKIY